MKEPLDTELSGYPVPLKPWFEIDHVWYDQRWGEAMNIIDLTEKVLSLPVEERIKIADSVYRSLNSFETEIEGLWTTVAGFRATEIDDGGCTLVSGPEVMREIKSRYE